MCYQPWWLGPWGPFVCVSLGGWGPWGQLCVISLVACYVLSALVAVTCHQPWWLEAHGAIYVLLALVAGAHVGRYALSVVVVFMSSALLSHYVKASYICTVSLDGCYALETRNVCWPGANISIDQT